MFLFRSTSDASVKALLGLLMVRHFLDVMHLPRLKYLPVIFAWWVKGFFFNPSVVWPGDPDDGGHARSNGHHTEL